jgi:hypothetical protein
MTYELVHTVWDYYDGPRSGIADYAGAPHHYVCEFDDEKDDYTERFLLRPIDSATFERVKEQWKRWRTWELAFQLGERDKSSHPALPGQDDAYAQLGIEIKSEIDSLSTAPIVAGGVFRARSGQPELPKGVFRELEVEWSLCNPTSRSNNDAP